MIMTLEDFFTLHENTEKGDLIRELYEMYLALHAAHTELEEARGPVPLS